MEMTETHAQVWTVELGVAHTWHDWTEYQTKIEATTEEEAFCKATEGFPWADHSNVVALFRIGAYPSKT